MANSTVAVYTTITINQTTVPIIRARILKNHNEQLDIDLMLMKAISKYKLRQRETRQLQAETGTKDGRPCLSHHLELGHPFV